MNRAFAVVAIGVIAACGSSKQPDLSIAEIVQVVAQVERETTPSTWTPANVGDKLVLGNAIRTGPVSHARLSLTRGGVLELDANAVVRFADRPGTTPGQTTSDLQVEAGNVELEAGEQQIAIGQATLEKRAKVKLVAHDGGVDIRVTIGKVLVEREGKQVAVEAGASVTVQVGRAVLEPTRIARDAAVVAVAVDAAEPVDAAVVVVEPDAAVVEVVDAGPAVAQMTVKVSGKFGRIQTEAGETALTVGEHQVDVGAIVTGVAGTTIEIITPTGRATITGPSESQIGGPEAMVTVVTGTIVLRGQGGAVFASVPGGLIGAKDGGETRAQIRGRGADIEVRKGEGVIRKKTGDEVLKSGDLVVLKGDGGLDAVNRAPTAIVFSVPAGESAVVHAMAATPIGIRFGTCTAGVLELAKDRSFRRVLSRTGGRSSGNVLAAPGSQAYRVTCDGGKAVIGSLSVVRDSGRKPLPKVAPRTLVEADGREYVITYQNLLPELTLLWRDAPTRSSYQFMIQSAKGDTKKIVSSLPRLALKGGDFVEGSYKFWVEIPDTKGRSETTRISIDFDNAQPTASIEQADQKDGKVMVKGSVIAGSSVSSGGAPIALDRHLRFETELTAQPGETGVAIRIAHPKLGVHYYVVSSTAK